MKKTVHTGYLLILSAVFLIALGFGILIGDKAIPRDNVTITKPCPTPVPASSKPTPDPVATRAFLISGLVTKFAESRKEMETARKAEMPRSIEEAVEAADVAEEIAYRLQELEVDIVKIDAPYYSVGYTLTDVKKLRREALVLTLERVKAVQKFGKYKQVIRGGMECVVFMWRIAAFFIL